MKILVTGGQGYVGSYLVKSLLKEGHTVVTLDSGFNSVYMDYSGCQSKPIRHQATIVNEEAVLRSMQGVHMVYHLAARCDWELTWRHPVRLMDVNVRGTYTVLSMAKRAGVSKVVFTSSAAVYGNLVDARPTDVCNPVTLYGASKLAAEAACRGFYQMGMDVVILRLYNVWGGKLSRSVVNRFTNGGNVIYGDGLQTRDFVHISDVVDALSRAAKADSIIANIGTGEEVTIEGLWSKLKNGAKPEYKEGPVGLDEVYRSCADVAYTKLALSWEPKINLSQLNASEVALLCSD